MAGRGLSSAQTTASETESADSGDTELKGKTVIAAVEGNECKPSEMTREEKIIIIGLGVFGMTHQRSANKGRPKGRTSRWNWRKKVLHLMIRESSFLFIPEW